MGNITVDSSCKYGFQHFSGIYRNGKKVCIGNNHLRNSYNGRCTCFSTHAEMDVLYRTIKSKNTTNLSNYTIVVLRISKEGNIKNSRPCNQCLETMIKYRIKKIIWSTDSGTFNCEKPQSMELLHTSSGWSAFLNPERLK